MWVLPKATRDYLNELTPRILAERFSPEELKGQFVLSRMPNDRVSWPAYEMDGWHLSVEPSLPCVPIRSSHRELGWLLGHALDAHGKLVTDALHVSESRFEESLYEMGSRFMAIVPALGRVYIDPCGFMSVVYSASDRIVASSAALIPYSDRTEDRTALMKSIEIPFGAGMYPMGMTSRHGIDRIVPNHYLDLKNFTTVRHWPVAFPDRVEDPDETISEIIAITKRQIRATVESGKSMLMLTSGKDSRMLLACSRDVSHELETATCELMDVKSWGDCVTARKLSDLAGIRHRVYRWEKPGMRELELWLYRTSMCAAEERGWLATATYDQADGTRASIMGSIGELGRSTQYWRPGDTAGTRVTKERLLSRCRCDNTAEALARYESWMDGINGADCFQLLDLAYTEQLMGGWGGTWVLGQPQPRFYTFPFNHRRTLQLMMQLPLEFRRSGALPEIILAREWPELLRIPFNQLSAQGNARAALHVLYKALRDPRKAYRKLGTRLRRSVGRLRQ